MSDFDYRESNNDPNNQNNGQNMNVPNDQNAGQNMYAQADQNAGQAADMQGSQSAWQNGNIPNEQGANAGQHVNAPNEQDYSQGAYTQPQQNSNYNYQYNQNGYNQNQDSYQSAYSEPAPPAEPPKPRKKSGRGIVGAAVAAAVVGAFAGSLLTGFVVVPMMADKYIAPQIQEAQAENTATETMPTPAEESTQPNTDSGAAAIQDTSNPVPEIVENTRDSVVEVITYSKDLVSGQEPVEQDLSGGSGFVLRDDYVVTNNHVIDIDYATNIKVRTNDGRELQAELVGSDKDSELAVLKVDGLDLPALPIGNSSEMRAGEMVIAIGTPLRQDLQNSVTVGYLSAESRTVTTQAVGEDRLIELEMLQIDAAINPGNSGGPLLNSKGEVVGINTMKSVYAGDGIQTEGIGFAIPITGAMEIIDTLIDQGGIVKPGIGFSYNVITAEDAEMWDVPKGILIKVVNEGSPAQEAGLKVNDIITVLDGVDLTQADAEVPVFTDKGIGDKVSATVWRDGKEFEVEFVLADLNNVA